MRTYTTAKKDAHQPDPCPNCGTPVTVTWVDITTKADGPPASVWVIGSWNCRNPDCDPVDWAQQQ